MKREDLEKLGLSKEQIDSVCDLNDADVQPLKTKLQETQDELQAEQEKVKTTEEALKKFDGVDVAAKDKLIADLREEIAQKEAEHKEQIASRDFNDLVKECIAAAKGRNAKAITALLEVDKLKASKNQKADIEAALKALTEAEDSKMLFGEPDPDKVGKGNPIGVVTKAGKEDADSLRDALAAKYDK